MYLYVIGHYYIHVMTYMAGVKSNPLTVVPTLLFLSPLLQVTLWDLILNAMSLFHLRHLTGQKPVNERGKKIVKIYIYV